MSFYTNLEIQRRVNALLNSSSTDENDENWLSDVISSREYNLLPFHNAFAVYILRRISKKIDLSELNKWNIFHVAFRNFLIANIGIELRCTEIRRHILLGSVKSLACVKQFQNLSMSIAVQCNKNEYVYYSQPDEIDAINKIRLQFDQLIENNAGWEVIDNLLHLILMYFSPLDLKHLKKIEFGEYSETNYQLAVFIGSIITDSEKEIELSNKYLNSFTLKSHVSKKVAAMYERNPYPRWTEPLVSMNPNRATFEEFTGVGGFPKYRVWQRSIDTILIAGCGTGRHPIQVALNYPWMKIKAIDISYRSIGYASMMAEKAGVKNIEFDVCDILDLEDYDEQYDMVDCIGVLHHLKHPDEGLRILLSRLRVGGLIRLGLYSKSAREAIIRFRHNNALTRQDINPPAIRKIRRQIIEKNDAQDRTILLFDDFYTLSGCRDLLFHEQEMQYTLPEIKALLGHHKLTFLGLGMPHRSLRSTIHEVCGANADIHDLDNWHKAESRSPFLFSGMYNFFAQVQPS